MAEKCTKTSSPFCRLIKPYPLASLNHFTVPCSIVFKMYLSICFVYAGRESECLGQVLAGLQEAAQKPNQIKRIYSLTDEAGFHQRYKNGVVS